MSFHLEERKLPNGACFGIETACAKIPAALEAAANKMEQEAAAVWITDR